MKTIRLYKYEGSLHCDGGCFPPYDERMTEWSDNRKEQVNLYNSATLKNFDTSDFSEHAWYNKYCSTHKGDIFFVWLMIYYIDVPENAWKWAVKNDNYDELPYYVNYDYTHIAERGIYLNGHRMPEKRLNEIIYESREATNKPDEKTGTFKPEGMVYGLAPDKDPEQINKIIEQIKDVRVNGAMYI
jgi:hypothetical protein